MSLNTRQFLFVSIASCVCLAQDVAGQNQSQVIESRLVHLRSASIREWSDFPDSSQGVELEVHFQAKRNDREFALRLWQQDVKQGWKVLLNGKPLGELLRDENEIIHYLPVPLGALVDGDNLLRIEPQSRNASTSDDIRVGQLQLEPQTVSEVLHEGTVEVSVTDGEKGLPCRLTIVDGKGALQSAGARSNDQLAVRSGTIYTSRGVARFGLPAGRYTVYAGRGFEYSLARAEIIVTAGQTIQQSLMIQRDVPMSGYISCDTHVHTLTHSGHGDATINERLITLAGEGIELPIATDHNVNIDYEPTAKQLQLREYFTPVTGNEVTTSVGHFNVFPVSGTRVPDFQKKDWGEIFDDIFLKSGARVAILNHARDLHSGVRPFGPKLFNAAIGENLQGWPMRFNAMEVVNSSAVQTEPLQLFHDWMAVLNRGYKVTPVGSSDSHDVARHFVGQGRTYIRGDDNDPGNIDVEVATSNFISGRVLVSYGLVAELAIVGQYRSGDLAPLNVIPESRDTLPVELRVLGPGWTQANRLLIYSNGTLLRDEMLPDERDKLPTGVLWKDTWNLPRPRHDVYLVAIALGPGIREPYWKTAKPYQPTSPDWRSQVIGCSGAAWFDGDGDGKISSARTYAERVVAASKGELSQWIAQLAQYDSATATQAAHLYQSGGGSVDSDEFSRASAGAPPAVRTGFGAYLKALRDNELAR